MSNPLSEDAKIIYLESTDSTMLAARRLTAGNGTPAPGSGSVVRAGYQSMGRGRLTDRRWEVNPGDGLMFTVIFTASDLKNRMCGGSFTLLPLLCGLAVAETVEGYLTREIGGGGADPASDIKIKWPNDVLAGGRKLSGILCEASGNWVYAGIGVNINQAEFPDGLRRPAASLRMLSGSLTEADDILSLLLERLDKVLAYSDWRNRIEERLYGRDYPAEISSSAVADETPVDGAVQGIIRGINDDGALLLESSGRILPFVSGELKFLRFE